MQPIKSFREYVEKLRECGEIVTVEQEVDWNMEMSAITRHAYDLPSPAPLFKNIKECTPGFEVLGAPVGLSLIRNIHLNVWHFLLDCLLILLALHLLKNGHAFRM